MKQSKELIRETGIDVLGGVPWGMHACLFYNTKEDLSSMLVPYFKAGLENNEYCMWVTSEILSKKEAEDAMRKAVPDFDEYLRAGQIEILSHRDWYLKQGHFEKRKFLRAWIDKLNQALTNGYSGMRVTGNTSWVDERAWKDFNDYEHELNSSIDRYQMIAVCTYRLDRCSTAEIIDVVNTHQLVLLEKRGEWGLVKNAERIRAEKRAREYQAQLKSLTSQLTLAEESERHRIATELHASIGQSLASTKLELDALRHRVSPKDPDEALKEVSDSIGKAIDDMRSLTFDLSFPILYELGFEAAVATWLADQIEEKHHIATEFEDDEQPKPLDEDVCVLLFRTVRELLFNVVRHAKAKKVKVSISRVGRQIQVGVEDDGIGFDPEKTAATAVRKGGCGLFSIRERLEQFGGQLEIESAPGQGCRVTVTAPLRGE